MAKVKCIMRKSHPDYGYFKGEQAEIEEEAALELEEQEYVEIITIKGI